MCSQKVGWKAEMPKRYMEIKGYSIREENEWTWYTSREHLSRHIGISRNELATMNCLSRVSILRCQCRYAGICWYCVESIRISAYDLRVMKGCCALTGCTGDDSVRNERKRVNMVEGTYCQVWGAGLSEPCHRTEKGSFPSGWVVSPLQRQGFRL